MNKKINLILWVTIAVLIFPIGIKAGNKGEDVTYELKTKLDQNYEYGNVKKCRNINGLAYWIGITKVSDLSVCLWKEDYDNGLAEFSCEDKDMEQFSLEAIAGGENIYGVGCRKPKKAENIKYIQKEIYLGESVDIKNSNSYNCSKISGDAGSLEGCKFTATKLGTFRVKATDKKLNTAEYYEYKVVEASAQLKFDAKYEYGDVKKCQNASGSGTAWFEGIKTISGKKVCLWNKKDAQGNVNLFTCVDNEMEQYSFEINDSGKMYYGLGCRKIKDKNNISYEKRDIYLGENISVGDPTYSTCSIISGDAGYLGSDGPISNECYLTTSKVGSVRIKVINNKTLMARYYEYNVKNASSSLNDLDQNYVYGDVKNCVLNSNGYNIGKKVKFDEYEFCATKLHGNYNYNNSKCSNDSFELFEIKFQQDGEFYKGVGCRISKDLYDGNVDPEVGENPNLGEEVTGCEVIPEVIRKWINNILKFVRYVALALVIALGALDFMKAAGTGEPDAMKKAGQSFMKRMIAVVILFLLPVIVDFILNMVNIYGVPKDNIDCL